MKFTIEVEQEAPDKPATVRITVDGKVIDMVQRVEFDAKANAPPRAMIRFSEVSKTNASVLGDSNIVGILNTIKSNISHHRRLLSNFPWIDVP
jgi:hypothetical protein